MSVRRAQQYSITLAPVESAMRPRRSSGIGWQAGDVKVWNGGTFANAANLPVEIAGASGRYALDLTAAEMNAAWVHELIEKDGIDPIDVFLGTDGSPSGQVLADAGNNAGSFLTDRAEVAADFWKDCLLLFTSGSLAGQVKKISGYNAATHFVTVASPFTGTPANGDRFVLINL
jgi:hypothetical protein